MALASLFSLVYTATYITVAFGLPAYNTYKAIEHRGDKDVRDWSCYWVVLAFFMCMQYFVDLALRWLPFYYPFKLAFLLYLWHPASRGALSIYHSTVGPALSAREADIDLLYYDTKAHIIDLMSQQMAAFRASGQRIAAKASALLIHAQHKAMEKHRATTSHATAAGGATAGAVEHGGYQSPTATVGHGLHTE